MSETIQLFDGAHDGQVFDKPEHGSYVRVPIIPDPSCDVAVGLRPVESDEYFITGDKTSNGHFKAVLTGII